MDMNLSTVSLNSPAKWASIFEKMKIIFSPQNSYRHKKSRFKMLNNVMQTNSLANLFLEGKI